jgi:hypothetical protein
VGKLVIRPFRDLFYLQDASLKNAEARRADENSPLFQQREKGSKKQKSPRQGTTEIFYILVHCIFSRPIIAADMPYCGIVDLRDSAVPCGDSIDYSIPSPPLKRRAIFIRPFGLGCFRLDISSPWQTGNRPPIGGISGLHINLE